MKRNRLIGLSAFTLSLLVISASPALAHPSCWGTIGSWQQHSSSLTKKQQARARKIDADYGPPIHTLRQQILAIRHKYNALLTARPQESAKAEVLAKELSMLNQSLDEMFILRDVALVQAGVPHGPGPDISGCGVRGAGYP